MDELHARGIRMSIDDFGTGYSVAVLPQAASRSTSSRSTSPSFATSTSDPEDAAIVDAIIQLGRTLQLAVIAEGVESESQLSFLYRADCDEMQGYLFSRPVAAAELEALLKEGRRLQLPQADEDGAGPSCWWMTTKASSAP